MTAAYAKHISTRETPQCEPIPGTDQVANSAGGFAFPVDDWTRLDRFLILGAEGGSYYATERTLTKENAEAVLRCLRSDGRRAVDRIATISKSGRAPKNDPAVFALALAASVTESKEYALDALPQVCRIGTHLFQFVEAVKEFRGRGRSLNSALRHWYVDKAPRDLAYQAIKYQQRGKWSHRDVLRLCKPKTDNESLNSVLHWITKGWPDVGTEPHPNESLRKIWAMERAKRATDKGEIVRLVMDHDLPRECIPTEFLTEPAVWGALLDKMPMTAMVRNLATMTRVGLLKPLASAVGLVSSRLRDQERLRKARIHPISLLVAMKAYSAGRGERGSNTWNPVSQVVDALNDAFYLAFGEVRPTGKRFLLALDVSGSMGSSMVAGVPNFSCREVSAAMSLVTAATEKNYHVIGFTGGGFKNSHGSIRHGGSGVEPLSISPRQRLDDVVKSISNLPMGRTDCALPMLYAAANRIEADAFIIYTDNETWCGDIHPCQALQQYRQRMGIPAKLVVMSCQANAFSIADPNDAGMLDVVGFDTAAPNVIADFVGDGLAGESEDEE